MTDAFGPDFNAGEFDPELITDLDQVMAWLGNPNLPDDLIRSAWLAAEAYVGNRTDYGDLTPPADLVEAVNLLTARYLARRNSPDGMVGLGDLGPAQVAYTDADVERLINPWRTIAVA